MAFFDLNIPYTESPNQTSTNNKSTRLKLAVKAMELGYTGVAYNRTITGVMSKDDHCSIFLFPLSSVLKLSPSISSAVNLHRRLLNVPTTAPFRQYTRLTFVVDSEAKGSCLNSGNPVIKSYDIVAVRPLSQDVFDKACKSYEVDIIAIDFSANRFQLRQPLIKAAIERGVYFEITYSGLLVDAPLRRQIISNAKLLVDWTRGKNVIFSSAAASVTEFRGPYDVANLACLLGFSMERAKASLSKTCRSLLENSLRKKKFYKEAIRVELISSTEDDSMDDWLKWDPISSDEVNGNLETLAGVETSETCAMIIEEPEQQNLSLKVYDDTHEENVIDEKEGENMCSDDPNSGILIPIDDNPSNLQCEEANNLSLNACLVPPMTESNEAGLPEEVLEQHMIDTKDVAVIPVSSCLASSGVSLNEDLPEEQMSDAKDVAVTPVSSCLAISGVSLGQDILEEHMSVIGENVSTAPISELATLRPLDEMQINGCDSVVHEPLDDLPMEVNVEVKDDSHMNHFSAQESSSGRVRRKHGGSGRSMSFPFRRWLKPSHSKKTLKERRNSTIRKL
ncbi:protein GAMETOPHYTE DEFECTIVE 1 isoform X2 [Helianthus annuus]|uniref:protein GAMETOPHYTE DEFECTIVE 1 isoform X2 n=1 Tax=Helianthus annuus TaxID=4232 RepID=UPI000B8F5B1D|nr:protein GAMETOPHYTE DEFECTIVE 1 isoform X2 [Helianthus annuus]